MSRREGKRLWGNGRERYRHQRMTSQVATQNGEFRRKRSEKGRLRTGRRCTRGPRGILGVRVLSLHAPEQTGEPLTTTPERHREEPGGGRLPFERAGPCCSGVLSAHAINGASNSRRQEAGLAEKYARSLLAEGQSWVGKQVETTEPDFSGSSCPC